MTAEFPQYADYVHTAVPGRPEHPSLRLPVTQEDRDRAHRFLREAYADGRLAQPDLERRLGQVLSAAMRRDLNIAFYGLVELPRLSASAVEAGHQPVGSGGRHRKGRAAAAIAHWSPFVAWIFGPLLVYLVARPGTFARQEAAKAFNFQVIVTVGVIALGLLMAITDGYMGELWGIATGLGWFGLTLVDGVKAATGRESTNPVRRALRWETLRER